MTMNSLQVEQLASKRRILITASNRQARFWAEQYHAFQARSSEVWPSPTILPVSAFLMRLYQELSYFRPMPMLLSPQQSLVLWEDIIEQSDNAEYLISAKATARKVQEAFQIMLRWNVPVEQIISQTEDHEAFIEWAQRYQTLLAQKQALDPAGICGLLLQILSDDRLLQHVDLPEEIELSGFHQQDPVFEQLMQLLASKGIGIVTSDDKKRPSSFNAVRANDFDHEIKLACEWCIDHLKHNADARIALIIPELDKRRFQVAEILKQQLHPEALTELDSATFAFNMSVGTPLFQYPFTRVAVSLIKLINQPIERDDAAELLKTNCHGMWQLIGGKTLVNRLASVAFKLSERQQERWTLTQIFSLVEKEVTRIGDPDGLKRLQSQSDLLDRMLQQSRQTAPAEQWAHVFLDWLTVWQWPGTKTLSSQSYQLREQLVSYIQQLRQFNFVKSKVPFSRAFQWLMSLLEGEVYQPKSRGEPIQVIGLYEGIGQHFDAVWISGLSNEVLPESPNPNPFIPLSLARQHGMPGSGPERELDYARSLVDHLLKTSERITTSFYALDNERELSPTPLLNALVDQWQPADPVVSRLLHLPDVVTEQFNDDVGLPITEVALSGGSQFLQAQALCPMQGYLGYRLKLIEQEEITLGVDPRDRGIFVHQVMQQIWETLGNQASLLGYSDDELHALIDSILEQSTDQGMNADSLLAQLEKEKFAQLIFQLLQLEKKRAPFTVAACELSQQITIDGLEIQCRLDRIDELDDGRRVIIDYKTGQVDINKWFGERLCEPQMPLYLLSDKTNIAALAFAQLHHKGVKFSGVSEEDKLLPAIKSIEQSNADVDNWQDFIYQVETGLKTVTEEIKSGYAAVDPDTSLKACDYCPFDGVCRITEITQMQQAEESR